MTEHGPDIDDPANIPFREPLGPPMTHAQLAHAYRRRERCEDELQDAKQRIAVLEAALAEQREARAHDAEQYHHAVNRVVALEAQLSRADALLEEMRGILGRGTDKDAAAYTAWCAAQEYLLEHTGSMGLYRRATRAGASAEED